MQKFAGFASSASSPWEDFTHALTTNNAPVNSFLHPWQAREQKVDEYRYKRLLQEPLLMRALGMGMGGTAGALGGAGIGAALGGGKGALIGSLLGGTAGLGLGSHFSGNTARLPGFDRLTRALAAIPRSFGG